MPPAERNTQTNEDEIGAVNTRLGPTRGEDPSLVSGYSYNAIGDDSLIMGVDRQSGAPMKAGRWLSTAILAILTAMLMVSSTFGCGQPAVIFDFEVTNDGGIRFADEYERLGGVDTLGHPASYRFNLGDGFTYQVTQRALLQWRPEANAAYLGNIFQMLEQAGLDDWLLKERGIPLPIKDDGAGGDWNRAKEARLSWLTNEQIKAKYLANPNPDAITGWSVNRSIELYGLPMSRPERYGPFISQRFQRVAFQLWVEEIPGSPAPGTVIGVLAGDLLKQAGLVPPEGLNVADGGVGVPPTPDPTSGLTDGDADGAEEQTPAPATRLTVHNAFDSVPTWSPDGRRIAFGSDRDGNWDIYVMNADGSGVARLTDNDAVDSSPAWSPDGRRIAFVSPRDGNLDIYVMNADGSGVTRLTHNDAYDWYPAWSPDGRRIAFDSDRDGNREIYVMNADGSGVTRLTYNGAVDGFPAWSPDSRRIAFVSERDGNWDIYVMNADGSGVTRLTYNEADDWLPAWSPDGRRIAFVSVRDGNLEIYVMNADGSGVTRLTYNDAHDSFPEWSPDGRQIAFHSHRDGNMEIYVMNATGEPG